MGLSHRNIVAVLEMVAYIPIFVLAVITCSRHGFSKSSGFFFILTLSIFRLVGSGCQLATIANPDSTGLITAAVALDHIGLSAVMMSTLGMLSRLGDWVNHATGSPIISIRIFRLIQLIMMVGGILVIIGSSGSSSTSSGSSNPSAWSYASAVLYIVGYILVVLLYFKTTSYCSSIPKTERLLILVVGLSLPLVLVRLAWTVLSVFVHRGVFSATSDKIVVHVFMATVEEFLVAAMYVGVGFRLPKLSESEQGEIQSRPWKDRSGGRGGGRGGSGMLGGGLGAALGGGLGGGRRARRGQHELDIVDNHNGRYSGRRNRRR